VRGERKLLMVSGFVGRGCHRPAAGMLRPFRLAQKQNPSPAAPPNFRRALTRGGHRPIIPCDTICASVCR